MLVPAATRPLIGRPPNPIVARACASCGTIFEHRERVRRRLTCSRVCAYDLRGVRSSDTQCRKVVLTCEQCGKEKLVSPTYADRRFCSPACFYAKNSGPNCVVWKGGVLNEQEIFYRSQPWRDLCRLIWARDGAACQRCNAAHVYGGEKFHVHHIAGWTHFPMLRLEPLNLALLCQQCHGFVHSNLNLDFDFLIAFTERGIPDFALQAAE